MSYIAISQTTSLAAIDKVYLGIPVDLTIDSYPPNYSNINLFDADSGVQIFSYNSNSKKNLAMLLYKDFNNIDYNRSYIFSTSNTITPRSITQAIPDQYIPPVPGTDAIPEVRFPDINIGATYLFPGGPKLTDAYTIRGDIISEAIPAVPGKDGYTIPGSPEVVNPPRGNLTSSSTSNIIKFVPYYNSLNTVSSINLNSPINVTVGWSNPNISNYGNDTVVVNIVDTNYTLVKNVGSFTNNSSVTNTQLSNLPTGTYYFQYDFANKIIDYSNGNSSISYTNSFSFTTKHIQSVSATTGINSSTITIDVGNGFTGYSYLLTITGINVLSFSERKIFPFTFISPSANTTQYTAIVNNSTDITDTNSRSTSFTIYKYVTNLLIVNRIRQSLQIFVSWSGGSTIESFKYGSSTLSNISGPTTFNQGDPLDARSLTSGTSYSIQPVESNENNGNYGLFYFDSIEPNQYSETTNTITLTGTKGPFLDDSVITWDAYYKYANSLPDGFREYTVMFQSNTNQYTGTSNNNILSITNTNLEYGIPYTIKVVDITIATNYIFYEKPSNVIISPGYINYSNSITWTSSENPQLNVIIGSFSYNLRTSPITTIVLTEANVNTNKQIKFWPPNSTSDKALTCLDVITLTENTFTFWNGGTVPFFQDIPFSIQVGDYLYPQDDFSLFLFRNGIIVYTFKTDITLSSPFVWKPYTYKTTYLPNDQLKLKSNSHVNYGLSTFTFQTNATVTVPNDNYGIFSTVTSTLTIAVSPIPSFNVYLCDDSGTLNRLTLLATDQSNYTFQPYKIPLFNSTYLNINLYLLYELVNSPTVTIESRRFTLFQDATVTVPNDNYGIFSTVTSTLTITSPIPSFNVYLCPVSGSLNRLTLPATDQSNYTFQPYKVPLFNSTYLNTELFLLYELDDSRTIIIESRRFTLFQDATVTVPNDNYGIFSTVTSTLTIAALTTLVLPFPSFNVYLYHEPDILKPKNLNRLSLLATDQSNYTFQPYKVPLFNSTYLNEKFYLRYELVNSPTITIETTPFKIFQDATVTLDQPAYTIISTIVSTLNISSSFTVQLTNGITSYVIAEDMGTSIFSFKAYIFANTTYVNTNVKLQFILNESPSIIIESVVFQISSTYFTLDKPPTLVPEFARATSNVICVTQKKNNVPTTTISIKNNVAILATIKDAPHFAVPCGIITYLDELNALLKTMTVRTALLFLIQKYSIPIPGSALVSKKRYQYPTADANVQYPILQYNTTFRLGDYTLGNSVNTNPDLVEKIYDARILSIANNDTKTLSSYYTDMLVNATYWLNTLPPLAKDSDYVYCVARPINGSLKQIITASISLIDNQLIFTPLLLRTALLVYVSYAEGDIAILYSSARIADVISYIKTKYYETFLDDTTAL